MTLRGENGSEMVSEQCSQAQDGECIIAFWNKPLLLSPEERIHSVARKELLAVLEPVSTSNATGTDKQLSFELSIHCWYAALCWQNVLSPVEVFW